MTAEATIALTDLFSIHDAPHPEAAFYIARRRRAGRWRVTLAGSQASEFLRRSGWWAVPQSLSGDSPVQYHPKYAMAILSSHSHTATGGAAELPAQIVLPAVRFTTDEYVRRSMTLNGLRMSREYFESGSLRVLQLIAARLEAGQRDVVHNVLVYLMNQILDIRASALEARLLRAESVAAYLGVPQERVNPLFATERLVAGAIARRIEAGAAGPLRRSLDVPALIENQVRYLLPALRECQREERQVLWLLDEVVRLLYASRTGERSA